MKAKSSGAHWDSRGLPEHVRGLMAYLSQPHEKANEDLVLSYFRKVFGAAFKDYASETNDSILLDALAQLQVNVLKVKNEFYELVLERLIDSFARKHLGQTMSEVVRIAAVCKDLTTDQSEIIATLYACWNDLLIRKRNVSDEAIIADFRDWHPRKARFSRSRLTNALTWMRQNGFVPTGRGSQTSTPAVN